MCELVTGVQTCALPISAGIPETASPSETGAAPNRRDGWSAPRGGSSPAQIGRAPCRERVCQYVEISVDSASLEKKQIPLQPWYFPNATIRIVRYNTLYIKPKTS